MKKLKIDLRALTKTLVAFSLVGVYWYWVNQQIISDSGEAFSLTGYFLLMCVATAFFPLPANIIVLGAVKTTEPWLVAVVGGFATLFAYLLEYIVFGILFKFDKVANFQHTWIYKRVAPLFEKQKFFILTFTSFLPIPAEPLRIYAITRKYPKSLFMLSGFLGRIPRYFLLGYYGKDYVNSPWFLLGVFLFPAVLLLGIKGGYSLVNWTKTRYNSGSGSINPIIDPIEANDPNVG